MLLMNDHKTVKIISRHKVPTKNIPSLVQFKTAHQATRNAQLEMAKNLKGNGVSIEVIRNSVPLLTLEDIV